MTRFVEQNNTKNNHSTQYNNNQQNKTLSSDIQHGDTQHSNKTMLRIAALSKNDSQNNIILHYNTQYYDTQHDGLAATRRIVYMLYPVRYFTHLATLP
jgi:hypothetical protein